MKALKKIVLIFSIISCILAYSSCSRLMGHSVVLWTIENENIPDGTIVPVYIKSNISHVYVIGIPDTDKKLEVPLWQISEPSSKKQVKQLAEKFSEYQRKYAKVKFDGLPIRFEPVNTARQVYRLREGEIIRILYKGKGVEVKAGNSALQGEWLRVMTNDGTEGWCFSYNLAVYDERDGIKDSQEVNDLESDETLQNVINQIWYPENYSTMVNSGRVDLLAMNPDYQFSVNLEESTILLNVSGLQVKYPYTGYTKTGSNVYKFNDTNITMTIRRSNYIVIQYVDNIGKPYAFDFCTLSTDINEIIQTENNRRLELFESIKSHGPVFSSSNYGKLTFSDDYSFTWTGYQLLSPALITADSLTQGKVSFNYFLNKTLASEFDGMMTFTFNNNNRKVNFFYKLEENGLRLEDAQKAQFKGSLVQGKSINPVILFFANK